MFNKKNTLAEEVAITAQAAFEEAQEQEAQEQGRFQAEGARLRRLASVRSEAETWLRWEIYKRELKPMGLSWHDMTEAHHARIAQAGERAVERARAKEKVLRGG